MIVIGNKDKVCWWYGGLLPTFIIEGHDRFQFEVFENKDINLSMEIHINFQIVSADPLEIHKPQVKNPDCSSCAHPHSGCSSPSHPLVDVSSTVGRPLVPETISFVHILSFPSCVVSYVSPQPRVSMVISSAPGWVKRHMCQSFWRPRWVCLYKTLPSF